MRMHGERTARRFPFPPSAASDAPNAKVQAEGGVKSRPAYLLTPQRLQGLRDKLPQTSSSHESPGTPGLSIPVSWRRAAHMRTTKAASWNGAPF